VALAGLPSPEQKRARVQAMFDRIAPRYDRMNRLLTLGLDQRWRSAALDAVGVGPGDCVLDIACGTGDLCERLAARGARVLGLDFSAEMLRSASHRRVGAALVRADAEHLPLPDAAFTVVTCGFALRNFASLERALAEMARVLAPGGRLALVEVDRPEVAWLRAAHSLYFDRVVPRLGAWLSDREAYRYLPDSTAYLPDARKLRGMLEGVGFQAVHKQRFLLGAAQLLVARRDSGEAA